MGKEQKSPPSLLPLEEWLSQYPDTLPPEIRSWLENDRASVMIHEGRKLRSAEERLEHYGGVEKLQESMKEIGGNKTNFVILSACAFEPITGYEITRFGRPLGVKLGPGTLYPHIKRLLDTYSLERKKLLYVYNENEIIFVVEREGYQTTEDGFRSKVLLTQPTERTMTGLLAPERSY